MFVNVFRDIFIKLCFMVKQFLYIIGLFRAALGFWRWPLCSAWLGGVVAWMLDVHLYLLPLFLVRGVHELRKCGQLSANNIVQRHS